VSRPSDPTRSSSSGGAPPEQPKSSPKRRRAVAQRRRRALVIGLVSLLVLAGLGVGGVLLYAHWRFDQIPKISVPGLTPRVGDQPFNVLLVGSDSRQFVDTPQQAQQFGSASAETGQRSDVVIVARIAPALHEIKMLSIPRDTYVNVPGDITGISGPNRINAAFNSGPALLVQTVESSFHIPLSDYAEVNFPGFASIVDALGGIHLDFADPVRDAYSGLHVATTGCQLVKGAEALALVRSRHLQYEKDGYWQDDPGSDWSRIQRQDAFFRALIPKLKGVTTSPTGLNDLIGALTTSVVIDKSLTEGSLLSIAQSLRGASGASLGTETLPTVPYTTSGGADVLLPAAAPDATVIGQFLAFGTPASDAHTTAVAVSPPISSPVRATLTADTAITVTTIAAAADPGDVVYNTLPEPWNPTTC
jgi:LCP family protein required for cell wall assembly